jgi:hypothetical protein
VDIQAVAQTIQIIVAPVVMVTSCALVSSGLLQRYAAVNDRMRSMTHERMEMLRELDRNPESADRYSAERFRQIDRQLPELVHRHRTIRDGLLLVYGATAVFVACMFVIAIAAVARSGWLATSALLVFLGGTVLLLAAVVLIVVEVRTSHQAVDYEVAEVLALGGDGALPPPQRPAARQGKRLPGDSRQAR